MKIQPYRSEMTIKYWQWAWHTGQIRLRRKWSLNWIIEDDDREGRKRNCEIS